MKNIEEMYWVKILDDIYSKVDEVYLFSCVPDMHASKKVSDSIVSAFSSHEEDKVRAVFVSNMHALSSMAASSMYSEQLDFFLSGFLLFISKRIDQHLEGRLIYPSRTIEDFLEDPYSHDLETKVSEVIWEGKKYSSQAQILEDNDNVIPWDQECSNHRKLQMTTDMGITPPPKPDYSKIVLPREEEAIVAAHGVAMIKILRNGEMINNKINIIQQHQ